MKRTQGVLSTDALAGAAPTGQFMAGGERAVQRGKPLKAFGQSSRLVLTPQLFGLSPSADLKKPKPGPRA